MNAVAALLKIADTSRITALQKRLQFASLATCGGGLRVTHRADLFAHSVDRARIQIGRSAIVDGTIEVYRRGALTIGDFFFLGRSRLYCSDRIQIGNYVLVSDGVAIMDSNLHPVSALGRRRVAHAWSEGTFPDVYDGVDSAPVTIGDDVWIGFGACILKGVNIGQGAIVSANAVVTRDVPPWTISTGNPARVTRELRQDER